MTFKLLDIKNPAYSVPVKVILNIISNDDSTTESSNNMVTVNPAPLHNCSVTPNDEVTGLLTDYTIHFYNSVELPNEGSLQIIADSWEINVQNPVQSLFQYKNEIEVENRDNKFKNDNKITVVYGPVKDTLEISNLFKDFTTKSNTLKIKNLRNFYTTKEQKITINILKSENDYFKVMSCQNVKIKQVQQPQKLNILNEAQFPQLPGQEATMQFRFFSGNPVKASSAYLKFILPYLMEMDWVSPQMNLQKIAPTIFVFRQFTPSDIPPDTAFELIFKFTMPPFKVNGNVQIQLGDSDVYVSSQVQIPIETSYNQIKPVVRIDNNTITELSDYTFTLAFDPLPLTESHQIVIQFPDQLRLQEQNDCSCSLQNDNNSCCLIDGYNNKIQISIDNSVSQYQIRIKNVRNNNSEKQTDPIVIQTIYQNDINKIVHQNNSIRIKNDGKQLNYNDIKIKSSSYKVSDISTYTITFRNQIPIEQNGSVKIIFPDEFTITDDFKVISPANSNLSEKKDKNILVVQGISFTLGYPANSLIKIIVQGIKNPDSIQKTDAIIIQTLNSGGYLVEKANQINDAIQVEMEQAADFKEIQISPQNKQTGFITNYEFYFKFNNDHKNNDVLEIFFPEEIELSEDTKVISLQGIDNDLQFTINQQKLRIILTYLQEPSTNEIKLEITQIRNFFKVLNFEWEIRTLNSQTYLKNQRRFKDQTLLQPAELSDIVLFATPGLMQQKTDITLTFMPQNKISKGINSEYETKIRVVFPQGQFQFPQEEVCIVETSSIAQCQLNANVYTITQAGLFDDTITIVFKNIFFNYSKHFVPKSFHVMTYHQDNKVDHKITDLVIPHSCNLLCKTCYPNQINKCSTCFDNFMMVSDLQTCVETCPDDTHILINNICEPCYEKCYSCKDTIDNCISCTVGNFFYNKMCYNPCPVGKFGDVNSNTCRDCNTLKCKDCIENDSKCTACSDGKSLFQNKCIENCPIGYFSSQNVCLVCEYPCLICTAIDKCQMCDNTILYQDKCVATCPETTILQENICVACNNCKICIDSPNNCISCIQNSFRPLLFKNVCVDKCPEEISIQNKDATICHTCTVGCATCAYNPANCVTCEKKFNLYENKCLQICPQGYYGINEVCEACNKKCFDCLVKDTSCTACYSPFYLYDQQCVNQCPNGYYKQQSNRECVACSENCLECEEKNSCTRCDENNINKYLSKGFCVEHCAKGEHKFFFKCIDQCPRGYEVEKENNKCIARLEKHPTVYFVFLIAAFIWLVINVACLFCKQQNRNKYTELLENQIAVTSVIQKFAWIFYYFIMKYWAYNYNYEIKWENTFLWLAVVFYLLLNIVFVIAQGFFIQKDFDFQKWFGYQSSNKVSNVLILIVSIFTFRFHRIQYAKLFNLPQLSSSYYYVQKFFNFVNAFSLISFISEMLIIISASVAIHKTYLLNNQTLYLAIELVILSILMIIMLLIDIPKNLNHFKTQQQIIDDNYNKVFAIDGMNNNENARQDLDFSQLELCSNKQFKLEDTDKKLLSLKNQRQNSKNIEREAIKNNYHKPKETKKRYPHQKENSLIQCNSKKNIKILQNEQIFVQQQQQQQHIKQSLRHIQQQQQLQFHDEQTYLSRPDQSYKIDQENCHSDVQVEGVDFDVEDQNQMSPMDFNEQNQKVQPQNKIIQLNSDIQTQHHDNYQDSRIYSSNIINNYQNRPLDMYKKKR